MRRDLVRLRRKLDHSKAFREIYRMEPFKIWVCWEIVKLWKIQDEARFGPFETKIGSLKSFSRDLSNGSLKIQCIFY